MSLSKMALCLAVGILSSSISSDLLAVDNTFKCVNSSDFREYAEQFKARIPQVDFQKVADTFSEIYRIKTSCDSVVYVDDIVTNAAEWIFADEELVQQVFGLVVELAKGGDGKMLVICGHMSELGAREAFGYDEDAEHLPFDTYCYRLAADNGDKVGAFLAGVNYFKSYDFKSALSMFKKSAELGCNDAAFEARVMKNILDYVKKDGGDVKAGPWRLELYRREGLRNIDDKVTRK